MSPLTGNPGRDSLETRGDDCYDTPPEAVHALLGVEALPLRIWEPAAGHGSIVGVLRGRGHTVLASDFMDYGNPTHFSGRDFLLETQAPPECKCIVTNPPYKLAVEFVRHAVKLVPRTYMLMRLAFLEGVGRSDVVDEQLSRVWVFRNRLPRMHRDGWSGPRATSTIAFAWFVFDNECDKPIKLGRITWEKAQW